MKGGWQYFLKYLYILEIKILKIIVCCFGYRNYS